MLRLCSYLAITTRSCPHGTGKIVKAAWIFCSFATVLTIASRYLLAFCFFIPTSIIVACLACTELNKCGLITAGVFGLVTAACHLFGASELFNVYAGCEDRVQETDDIFSGVFDVTQQDCNKIDSRAFINTFAGLLWIPAALITFLIPDPIYNHHGTKVMETTFEMTSSTSLPIVKADIA